MKKRGQSAMEFLMTYGWAIIVVLVVLSALYFLGVFSPKTVSTCNIQAPFVCNDFKVLENGVIFSIGAGKISSGNVDSIKINGQDCNVVDGILISNEIKNIECSGVELSSEKINADITIIYALPSSDLLHTITGQGSSSNVEEGVVGISPEGLIFGWAGNDSNDFVKDLNIIEMGGLITGNSESITSDNNATYFNGMGDYLYIYDSSLINLMNVYDRSFSIWFKAANISSSAQVIFEEGGTSNGISFYLYGEELYYGFWGTTITNTFLSTPFTDINSWHHMGFTFDSVNGIQKAFLDGVEVGSSDRIGYIPAHSGDIAIGADKDGLIYHYGTDSGGPQNYFNGTIDEVKIWNRALSPEEIQFLYDYYQ